MVGRNIFLDGNTYLTSHSVAKKRAVGTVEVGFMIVTAAGLRFGYTHVFMSREFDLQPGKHEYGSVSVAFKF